MNLWTIPKPIHRPTIPISPANTGGAGIGNLRMLNIAPTAVPVNVV